MPSRGRTILYNIHERKPEFKGLYDVVLLFDVLEHIEAAGSFLESAAWHLKPGGIMLLNVPALSSLYSQYDKLVGHVRRYDKVSVRHLFQQHGIDFKLMELRYWGLSLVPIVWLRKMMLRKIQRPDAAVAIGFHPPAQWINRALGTLMSAETSLLSHPPFGSSLMVAARKHLCPPAPSV